MPAPFNSRTAYARDSDYMDPEEIQDGILHKQNSEGAETGVTSLLRCNLESVASSELATVATSLGISPDDTLCTAWQAEPGSDDPAPEPGDAILIDGVRWAVLRVIDNLGDQWQCIVASPGSRAVLERF